VPSQTHDRETAAACQSSGPIITMADPVISVGLGVLWLGVRLRSSPTDIFGQVASVLLMAAGMVVTAHHAPQVAGRAPAEQTSKRGVRLRRGPVAGS
jgi:hypothetical protein